jgi:multisubunit Na+/H+ antiporter MnhB subunit
MKTPAHKTAGFFLESVQRSTANGITLATHCRLVAAGFLVVAALELLAHWLLTRPQFRFALWFYSLHGYGHGGGVGMLSDLLIPAPLLGWWNGWVSRTSSSRRALAFAVLLGVGTVLLFPLYAAILGPGDATWWWPESGPRMVMAMAANSVWASGVALITTAIYHRSIQTRL